MRTDHHLFTLFALTALAAACSSSGARPDRSGSGGNNGSGGGGGVVLGGGGGGNTSIFTNGGGGGLDTILDGGIVCDRASVPLERKPAEILLVLDRSNSMEEQVGGVSKWALTVPGVKAAITATDASMSWGLKVFPEGEFAGACTVAGQPDSILVPVAPDNGTTVNAAIDATNDHGDGTPTGAAIDAAVVYLKTLTSTNTKYILLATDGEPSCYDTSGNDDQGLAFPVARTAITNAFNAGFKTFVVGISDKSGPITVLNDLAVAGGTAKSTNPLADKYYLASSQTELTNALLEITAPFLSCTFTFPNAPPAPEHIAVVVGDQKAPKDTSNANGWNYTTADNKTVEVFGTWCDMIKTSAANKVDFIFGCKDDPIF